MAEASPVKFYLAKFSFLVMAFVQWMVAATLLFELGFSDKNVLISLFFFSLGLIFLYLFLVVNEKVKRVAIGKNKIVIIEGDWNSRFSWPEVKSLKIIPFVNLYRLKLRGMKNPIYFFSSRSIDPEFGRMAKGKTKAGRK